MFQRGRSVFLAVLLAQAGCTTEFPLELLDATPPMHDSGAMDSGAMDSGAMDSGAMDSGAMDSGEPLDAEPPDADTDADVVRPCPEVDLVEGTAVRTPEPVGDVPLRGAVFRDPDFDTCLARITDAHTDVDSSSSAGSVLRGSVSADRVLALMGSYRFHLFDLNARTHLTPLSLYSENFVRLARDDASLLWLDRPFEIVRTPLAGGGVERTDLGAAITGAVADATEINAIHPYSPSADESIWALPITTSSGRSVVTIDLAAGSVLGARALATTANVRVGTSPSGDFIAIAHAQEDVGPLTALEVYTRDLLTLRFALTEADNAGAWDFARGPGGSDVLVYSQGQRLMRLDLEVPGATPVVVMDELTGNDLDPMRAASEVVISGAAYDQPGWVVVSFAACRLSGGIPCEPGTLWAQDRIALISLADGRVLNLAWHRSTRGGSSHPHALPSRDLSRVLFDSNWATGPVEVFVIELPEGVL